MSELLTGTLCLLEPPGEANAAEAIELDGRRRHHAAMLVGAIGEGGEARLIRSRQSGQAVGLVDSREVPGYPGVRNLNIFSDPQLARPGIGIEAFAMWTYFNFANGMEMAHLEVMDFNRAVHGIMRRLGFAPAATYRSHAFAAGRRRDVVVYAWDLDAWLGAMARYSDWLPGGGTARILGGAVRGQDPGQAL